MRAKQQQHGCQDDRSNGCCQRLQAAVAGTVATEWHQLLIVLHSNMQIISRSLSDQAALCPGTQRHICAAKPIAAHSEAYA